MNNFVSLSPLQSLLLDSEEPDYQFMSKFFQAREMLGEGSFSTVIRAYDTLSQKEVAIKILDKNQLQQGYLEFLRKETEILDQLNHINIVRFIMERESRNKIYIVQEFINGQCLEDFIFTRKQKQKPLQETEIVSITKQLVNALQYVHSRNIIHRDLKPNNIMIVENPDNSILVKLIDFGLATQLENQFHSLFLKNCGTLLFMAPELVEKKSYNWSVDIWALGLTVYAMYSMGRHPLWDSEVDNKKTFKARLLANESWPPWPENMGEQAKSFVLKTANYRADSRMTSNQCIIHPWLQGSSTANQFITLGDMITVFTHKQTFFRQVHALMFLKSLQIKKGLAIKTQFLYEPPVVEDIIINQDEIESSSSEKNIQENNELDYIHRAGGHQQISFYKLAKQRYSSRNLMLPQQSKQFLIKPLPNRPSISNSQNKSIESNLNMNTNNIPDQENKLIPHQIRDQLKFATKTEPKKIVAPQRKLKKSQTLEQFQLIPESPSCRMQEMSDMFVCNDAARYSETPQFPATSYNLGSSQSVFKLPAINKKPPTSTTTRKFQRKSTMVITPTTPKITK